jgi:cytochrome P450
MGGLHPAVPRAGGFERFQHEPLRYLAEARSRLGDLFVLREDGAVFSRTPECRGVVAAFGATYQRAVLTDPDTFAMPPSAARQLHLTDRLADLNRSLHSMRGEQHAVHKRLLTAAIDGVELDPQLLDADLRAAVAGWRGDRTVGLLAEMRRLALRLAVRVLFGEPTAEARRLATLLDAYFHLRREAASPAATIEVPRELLVEVGEALDRALSAYRRGAAPRGLLGRLALAGLADREIVGHANILFVSITEPIAVALTWIVLTLSQLPALRERLRRDDGAHPSLLDCVVSECLRLLPPNAVMVRITTRRAILADVELPEHCEVVLSPFVTHRDPQRFPRPNEFQPARWMRIRPSPFDYLPFGAGVHACVGRRLALRLIEAVLRFVVARFDPVLDGDQAIDWRLHILFMCAEDPRIVMRPASTGGEGGRLLGPVSELLQLHGADHA